MGMRSFDQLMKFGVSDDDVTILTHHLGGMPKGVRDVNACLYWMLTLLPWTEQAPLLRLWLARSLAVGKVDTAATRRLLHAIQPADPSVEEAVEVENAIAPYVERYSEGLPRHTDGTILLSDTATPEQGAWLGAHHAARAIAVQSLPIKAARVIELDHPEETVSSDVYYCLGWGIAVSPPWQYDQRLETALREVTRVTAAWLGRMVWTAGRA